MSITSKQLLYIWRIEQNADLFFVEYDMFRIHPGTNLFLHQAFLCFYYTIFCLNCIDILQKNFPEFVEILQRYHQCCLNADFSVFIILTFHRKRTIIL